MEYLHMHLKILLPFRVFEDQERVKRVVAETPQGAFGLLPNRLDCTAALAPGILSFEKENGEEVFVAVDEGVLVKAGNEVRVSVRNAVSGTELGELHKTVKAEFLQEDKTETALRSTLAKLESNFIRRMAQLKKA
jgi:F-type H+-transporting ATPase subunit epsilon